MENPHNDPIDPQDELRAANALLKLKLEIEHNMQMMDITSLSPEIENQWLKSIQEFEEHYSESKRVTVYDYIGRPSFPSCEALTKAQLREELIRLLTLMLEKGIVLDCCCQYEDGVIYRFITEELFECETDSFAIQGMQRHFIYEEFHPNHEYDLKRYARDFITSVLGRKWDAQYDPYHLAKSISFQDREHPPSGITSIVLTFQEAHTRLTVEEIQIEKVSADVDNSMGIVEAHILYKAQLHGGDSNVREGKCVIHFIRENDYWSICGFKMPGLGD